VIKVAFYCEKQNVLTKSSMADLVTETDNRVEEMIVCSLRSEFPTHWLVWLRYLFGWICCIILFAYYYRVCILYCSLVLCCVDARI